jgi:hypothetical protein
VDESGGEKKSIVEMKVEMEKGMSRGDLNRTHFS